MSAVQAMQEILSYDYKTLAIILITLIMAAVAIKKLFDEFLKLFNLETPFTKKENERKQEIKDIKEQLQILQNHQLQIQQNSADSDRRMEDRMERLEATLNSHIVANMRSTLWRLYKEAKGQNYTTKEGLKTFLECGKVYEAAGGDDIYHEKLYPEMMNLEVREE